jgi:uroporphyrinogen decarboxylase
MRGDKLNSLDRVMTVLELGEPDRIPTFEWCINKRTLTALLPGKCEMDFIDEYALDGVVVYADYNKVPAGNGSYTDEWGVTYRESDEDFPQSTDFPLKNPEDIDNYIPPDPEAEWRFDSLKEAVRRFKGKKAILFRLRDAGSIPRYLRGMENLMMDYLLNKDLIHRIIEISIEYYTRLAYRAIELGADIFWSSDDYCDNRGPIMGPEIFYEFILPGLKKIVKAIRGEGYYFIKHNDGNIKSILPDLVETGISCIDPIDRSAGMDLAEVKRDYGNRIAIKGGVDLDLALSRGTIEDTVKAVKECILQGGPGGGYILSSSSEITASVKPENYMAMLKTLQQFGSYR